MRVLLAFLLLLSAAGRADVPGVPTGLTCPAGYVGGTLSLRWDYSSTPSQWMVYLNGAMVASPTRTQVSVDGSQAVYTLANVNPASLPASVALRAASGSQFSALSAAITIPAAPEGSAVTIVGQTTPLGVNCLSGCGGGGGGGSSYVTIGASVALTVSVQNFPTPVPQFTQLPYATAVATWTPPATATPVPTATNPPTATPLPTFVPYLTAAPQFTQQPLATPGGAVAQGAAGTPWPVYIWTTPTYTPTISPTPSISPTFTASPTASPSFSASPTPTIVVVLCSNCTPPPTPPPYFTAVPQFTAVPYPTPLATWTPQPGTSGSPAYVSPASGSLGTSAGNPSFVDVVGEDYGAGASSTSTVRSVLSTDSAVALSGPAGVSGTITAVGQSLTVTATGFSGVVFQTAATVTGTMVAELSVDGGTTWSQVPFWYGSAAIPTVVISQANPAANSFIFVATNGAALVRLRCSAYTSGTGTFKGQATNAMVSPSQAVTQSGTWTLGAAANTIGNVNIAFPVAAQALSVSSPAMASGIVFAGVVKTAAGLLVRTEITNVNAVSSTVTTVHFYNTTITPSVGSGTVVDKCVASGPGRTVCENELQGTSFATGIAYTVTSSLADTASDSTTAQSLVRFLFK